ncbi:hypothetical protein [Helicobacter sp. 11S02629-2]|uniref:hypothetical protein n=1 Tax=Helicobacter sp. 11S02629-2 TaxID=1476195 RepID=UPI000BA73AAB|nr:hypothetical protein [Helicobacter sp. 11S02629-2]PAF42075.1 hypothetical protein BKH40_08090 [Helicobacter sp. 11S02629-2]
MNSSSAASSAVLAGATGLNVAAFALNNPTLISTSNTLDKAMQQLDSLVDKLGIISTNNARLSDVEASNLRSADVNLNNAIKFYKLTSTSNNASTFAVGQANMLQLQNKADDALNLYNLGLNSTLTNLTVNAPSNLTLSALGTSLNSIVNGNNTLLSGTNGNTPNNSINNASAELSQLINQVDQARVNVSSSLGSLSQDPTVLAARNQQQEALSDLRNTLTALQTAVQSNVAQLAAINTARTNSIVRSANGKIQYSAAFNVSEDGWSALNTTTNINSSGSRLATNAQSLVNGTNGTIGLKSLIATSNALQDSAQNISNIVNGDSDGKVTSVSTVVNTLKDGNSTSDTYTKQSSTELKDATTGRAILTLKQAVANVEAANKKVANAVLAVAIGQNKVVGAAANNASKRNKAPTILPTAKAGIVAFFGKHQSVSVEYQYYFRNTNPNFTSGEVTLNYAYYFGGK